MIQMGLIPRSEVSYGELKEEEEEETVESSEVQASEKNMSESIPDQPPKSTFLACLEQFVWR
jgi:hypothetical protein